MSANSCKAFTLAELLIALAILGVIATFTIPKVLSSQQDSQWKASAKEVAGMISEAYQKHKLAGKATSATTAWDLTPYMNFVKVDTSTPVDDWQGTSTPWGCDSSIYCLVLHNGGRLAFNLTSDFTDRPGTLPKDDLLLFQFDPDGKDSGSATGAGKAIAFTLYFDGGIGTEGTPRPNSTPATITNGGTVYGPNSGADPPWFSWN